MKPRTLLSLVLMLIVAVSVFAWLQLRAPPSAVGGHAAGEASALLDRTAAARAADASDSRFPHAVRDQAKRDELRRRLLVAYDEAVAKAKAEEGASGAPPAAGRAGASRGEREPNDIEEFGRFVTQAIREDFLPMARACAKDLKSRRPDAGGQAKVAFELLGDKKIGGVVNSAEIVDAESTVHDAAFETCVRESLYGVYFDPPPANARATLNFELKLDDSDGSVEDVDDFHVKDRR